MSESNEKPLPVTVEGMIFELAQAVENLARRVRKLEKSHERG